VDVAELDERLALLTAPFRRDTLFGSPVGI
jgi:hypothetical protein